MADERKKKANAGHGGPAGQMMAGEKPKDFKGTMKKLAKSLSPYKFKLALVFIFAIVSTVFTIIAPTILGDATDVIVTGLFSGTGIDFAALIDKIIFLGCLYLISFVFSTSQGYIMAGVSQKVTYSLREGLSEKIDSLPLRYFDSKTHGEIQSRVINDIETVNQTLSQSITQIITSVASIVGMVIMMLRISVLMTIVAFLVFPISMGVIRVVVGRSQKHFDNQQKFLGNVNGHVEEMFTGHTIVKLFNREGDSKKTFNHINDKLCDSAWKSQFFSGMMMPITQFVGNLGFVAVCILGGYIAVNGGITLSVAGLSIVLSRAVSIGNIQAFIQYVKSFNQPVQQVANIANLLQSTAAAAERVFEVIGEEDEEDAFEIDRAAKGIGNAFDSKAKKEKATQVEAKKKTIDFDILKKGNIEFKNVSFGYNPEEIIIKDFSFTAKQGQRVAIVGPTGAGKTTIVKLLMRYYELNKGSISIGGYDIKDMPREELRDLFGMVLQDTWLFSGTIRDNLKYGKPDATEEEIEKAADMANIHHYINIQPEGYDTIIGEDAGNISQGQKQLLTIARAMLADNPVLILDEATSSVDTRTERKIQDAMAKLMHGRTSFVIAHRLSTIKDADWILVMDQGDIVEQGNHETLLAKDGFYAKLYNSQFAK